MAPIMHPAQHVFVGQQMVHARIITQQLAHNRHASLRVIGCNPQRIPNLLVLLVAQHHPSHQQAFGQVGITQILVPRQHVRQTCEDPLRHLGV